MDPLEQTLPKSSGNGKGPLVLVVDDNSFSRRVIVQLLQTAGFQTLEAMDGDVALRLLTTTPGIRLMTLDLEMPTMNGFQVLEAMRSPDRAAPLRQMDNGRTPVILVTANDTYANRRRGFELGAADFVHKDQVQEQLVLTARLITAPASAFSGMTVLVTEDAPLARRVIVACAQQLGVNVIEAGDGVAALDILRQRTPKVDLVITDMHMPRMNGDELCRNIRMELGLKELPILLLSGTADHETKLRLFQAGATDYLEKPFIKEELIARLGVYLKRQQLDRHLRENIMHLRELDKLKDEFLSICSHDLRTPLTGVLGFADILLRDPEIHAAQRNMLQQIHNSGHYLLELINDLLDLGHAQAQKENMEFEPLDVLELLTQCAGAFQSLAQKKSITLALRSEPGSQYAIVAGNRTALSRVFTNLISNAIKFTLEGGRVTLQVKRDESRDLLVIACTDSGIGIPSAMLPDLFNRYSKVSRPGTSGERGTGLGLSITRELVENHDGQISVKSIEWEGSTFTVELPVYHSPAVVEPVTAPSPSSAAAPLHLLVAEDNPVNLQLVTFLLEKMGHHVVTAIHGRLALEAVKAQTESFHAILMDIEMPEMDGRQASVAIRAWEREQHRKPTPILALTAHTEPAEHRRLLAEGFDAVVTKPIQPDILQATLRKVVR